MDVRDAARRAKIQAQRNPSVLAPGTVGAFSDQTAHPKVTNTRTDLKIDHKESHHLMPVDAYTAFTEGMTPEQIAKVDATMEGHAFYKGDNNLNRTDLWKRYHTGRSKGVYKGKGAHQVANQARVDGPNAKKKWATMSPDERFNNLDMFVDDMTKNRTIGYQANMESRWLLGSDNTPDNIYGGNFSQRILNPRNPELAASTAKKTKLQRAFLKSNRLAKGVTSAIPGPIDDFVVGGVMALGAGGLALLGGASPAAAGQVTMDTGVDIATGDLDGGTLANGELLYNQEKVRKLLQQGPVNTAAPTGDKEWDSAAQPFLKMLNGLPSTPKKPDFKQSAISAFNSPR